MALLLVIPWLEHVRCAIGCGLVGGAVITLGGGASPVGANAGMGALITLGGGALTVGAGVGVCTPTLGVGAG